MKRGPARKKTRLPRLVAQALALATRKRSWKPFREGVRILRLAGDPENGTNVALLDYDAGARVPAHRHTGFEVIYVLDGAQSDERGTYAAGTLVVNPKGLGHSVWSDDGCMVLIVWEHPVAFL